MTVPKIILVFLGSLGEIGGPVKCEPKKASLRPPLNGSCFKRRAMSMPDCVMSCLSHSTWPLASNVGNILPRLCIVCSLVASKHSYTVCDLLLKLTRPPSFRYWTCIKQEPGTENIDMYPEKQSAKEGATSWQMLVWGPLQGAYSGAWSCAKQILAPQYQDLGRSILHFQVFRCHEAH